MRVEKLCLTDFRNVKSAEICPHPGVNVFIGENAQGKTNALESLWLFAGGRSFRGSKDAELVRLGCDKATVKGTFFTEGRTQEAVITVDKRRHVSVNGIDQPAMNKIVGKFPAVVFFPDHLFLVKEGPEGRRRFMDAAICQIRPAYLQILANYNRVLEQRNALIKNWRFSPDDAMWEVFTLKLAQCGQQIVKERLNYTKSLRKTAILQYEGLSGGRETLSLEYEPKQGYETMSEQEIGEALFQSLIDHRQNDFDAGYTTVGPHREDLVVKINDLSARHFGSQGQQRSAVLALKLAEAEILKNAVGESPMVLLDDVMSELDVARQEYIVTRLKDWQVFITCCDGGSILPKVAGKRFHVKHGEISEVEES